MPEVGSSEPCDSHRDAYVKYQRSCRAMQSASAATEIGVNITANLTTAWVEDVAVAETDVICVRSGPSKICENCLVFWSDTIVPAVATS
jgi:hypothetical protein